MLRKLFAAISVVCILASAASAGVMGTVTQVADPPTVAFGAPDAALGAPWVSYILGLQTTAGEFLGAVDLTVNGQLHQRWADSDEDGTFEPTPNASNLTNGDTHITAPAGAVFGSGPTEDNSGSGSPLPDTSTRDYGVGTLLSGAWGIPGATNTTTDAAYIVVPKGSEPQIDIAVRIADIGGNIIAELTEADFIFGPPPGEVPVVTDFTHTTTTLGEIVATTLTATNSPTSWSGLLSPTYVPGFGAPAGAPGLGIPPTWDPLTQMFSFNTDGSTRGTYSWTVDATNAAGTSTGEGRGLITVNVTMVPEPATLTLFGLALVGLVGLIRRR